MGMIFGRNRPWYQFQPSAVLPLAQITPNAAAPSEPPLMPVDGVVEGTNTQRVMQAFTAAPPTPLEARAIRALLDSPGATEQDLSRACGWVKFGWRAHMLVACHRRQTDLWPDGLPAGVPMGFALTCLTRYEAASLRFWVLDDLAAFFDRLVATNGPTPVPN